MARPEKESCDFFFTSSKLLYDTKVKALRRSFKDSGNANNAFFVFDYLFREIFGNEGYHIRYTEDLVGDTADFCYLSESFVIEVIKKCSDIGLFHKEQFEKNGILTSRAIQRKYAKITEKRKRSAIESGFCVLDEKLMSKETELMSSLTPLMSPESTHRKEKKSESVNVRTHEDFSKLPEKLQKSLDKYWQMRNESCNPVFATQQGALVASLLSATGGDFDRAEKWVENATRRGLKDFYQPFGEEPVAKKETPEEEAARKKRGANATKAFLASMGGEPPCET